MLAISSKCTVLVKAASSGYRALRLRAPAPPTKPALPLSLPPCSDAFMDCEPTGLVRQGPALGGEEAPSMLFALGSPRPV